MALNIAWGLNKKISIGIFGVWIFGLLNWSSSSSMPQTQERQVQEVQGKER